MILRLLLMLVGHAGAWLLAAAIQARLRTGSRSSDVVGCFLLHALIVTLIVVIAGTARVLGLAALSAGGLLALSAGFALGGHRVATEAWRATRYAGRAAFTNSPWITGLSLLLIAVVLVRHALNVWFFTIASLDDADYHLPKLVTWIQTGGLLRPDLIDLRAYFPAGMQFSQMWWIGFLHHDVLIEAAGVEWTLMAAAAVFALGRRLGVSSPSCLLASAIFLCLPGIALNASTGGNDMAAAACVLAMFAFLVKPASFAVNASFALCALLLGIGVKPTVGFAAVGPVVLAVIAFRQRIKSEPPAPRVALVAMTAFCAFAGAYWYLVNWVEQGNPFYPVPVSLFGQSSRVGLLQQSVLTGPSLDRFGRNTVAIFGPRLFTKPDLWQSTLQHQSGWGYLVPILAIPALAWALVRRKGWHWPSVAVVIACASTLLLVEHDPWNARFLLWLPALFIVAAADHLTSIPSRAAAVIAAVLIAISGWHLWHALVPHTFRGEWGPKVTSVSWRERSLNPILRKSLAPGEWECITSRDGVLCIAYNYGVYTLAHPDFGRRVEHTSELDPERLLDVMRERDLRYLLLVNVPAVVADMIRPAVETGRLRPVCPGWLERTGR